MNSVPPKHPKKKRRIDDLQEDSQPLPGPSKDVVPLVAPQLVKKSSKDPNRCMYPSPKGKHKKSNFSYHSSSGEFVKASQLYRKQLQKIERSKKSLDSGSHNLNVNETLKEQTILDVNQPSNSKGDCVLPKTFKKFNSCKNSRVKKVMIRPKFGNAKITEFYKKSSTKQQTAKLQNSAECAATDPTKQLPQISGWKIKNKKILEALTYGKNEIFFESYCYGLVNPDSGSDKCGTDYFKILPTHIIETVLCQIPIGDLMTCRLVCSRWRDIIDNVKFMEWKKLYHKYKRKRTEQFSSPREILNEIIGNFKMEDCIKILLKYMSNGFNRMPSSDMHHLLNHNSKGELADQVLSERFPEFNGKESRIWCQFALSILLCETVWDIFYIYKSLFTSNLACSRPDINDAMYCVATFLLYYLSTKGINCGLHYRLFYVLYVIENYIPTYVKEKLRIFRNNVPGQQSIHNYGSSKSSSSTYTYLTYEQKRILNHKFDLNQKIKIIALAGTGKTTTLFHLSKLYPKVKFLNLVFNKSVSDEAKRKFPSNVTCKTAHSLAYSVVGKFLRHKLTSILRPYDLIGHLASDEDHMHVYAYASLVLATINDFTVSSAPVMNLWNVPMKDYRRSLLSFGKRNRILEDASRIWQKMIDENDPFKITHDVYLKLYHLKKPNLKKYQCIMVDEAQDCNPVILDIVLSQSMPVIFVGDPQQQMYSFRGAQNALESIAASHTYYLTRSFRFGPEIAYVASCVLELVLKLRACTLIGNDKDSCISGKVGGQYAVISRTNVALFNEALRMIVFKQLKRNEPTVIAAAFAGGINSYGFDQILDIFMLKTMPRSERQITDKFISRFKNFTDLLSYAKQSADSDLLSKIEIINQHEHNISKYIAILIEKCDNPIELSNVIFSTAHKAKGLEFDTVCLTDDYSVSTIPSYIENFVYLGQTAQEDDNVLYVALTRAKSFLLLPEKFKRVLFQAHEKFEYPVSSKHVLQDRASLNCVVCADSFTPHAVLTIIRRKLVMASGREITEGPLCLKCSTDPYMRPDIHLNELIMYLDPTSDNSHRFMSSIVGPLPDDPPVIHDRFSEFENADRVFVINLNVA